MSATEILWKNPPTNFFTKTSDALLAPVRWNHRLIEKVLLPHAQDTQASLIRKVAYYVRNCAQLLIYLPFLIATTPLGIVSIFPKLIARIQLRKEPSIEYPQWDQMDLENIAFPEDMLWGAATAEFQENGAENLPNCNWTHWERGSYPSGRPHIEGNQRSGVALNHWNNIPALMEKIEELGLNSYRFSIDWSAIEPEPGIINEEALQHYDDLMDALDEIGVRPMLTLHHFTHPQWFEERGAFENAENISYFVNFSRRVFARYSHRVTHWSTFNEPGVYVFGGYVYSQFPPGKRNLALAGQVLKNLMVAHGEVYRALKEMPGGNEAKIGIVHNILRFRPYHCSNPLEAIPCRILTHIVNDVVMKYLKTGEFCFQVPTQANLTFVDQRAPQSFDWFGLNYYVDPLIHLTRQSTCYPGQKMTLERYRDYPQGLASALESCREFNRDIIITENGCYADEQTKRDYYQRVLSVVSQAIQRGIPVKGYHAWTLCDNFEWSEGYRIRFGLYAFSFETRETYLRESSRYYMGVINNWRQAHTQEQEAI